MTNNDILTLNQSLHDINLKGAKFSYAVARNIELLKPEVTALQKAIDISSEYKEYDAKRIELCKQYANKDDSGEVILLNKGKPDEKFDIKDQKAFDLELDKLNKENQAVIDARTKQIKDFSELLEEDKEIAFYKCNLKDVPEEITTNELRSIIDIIEE